MIVELDGEEFHQDTFHSDHERDLRHAALDALTVRLVWDHLHARPARTAERPHRILADRRRRAA